MKRFLLLLPILCIFLSCAREPRLTSPDGHLSVLFRLTDEGAPRYAVLRDADTIICWSPLGFLTDSLDLSRDFRLLDSRGSSSVEAWETVWGEERLIRDVHHELRVSLLHASGLHMDILFRAFDDGVAFCYDFPEPNPASLTITDELTAYRFTADHAAWSIHWRTEYYEGIWTRSPLSQKADTLCSPLTLELADGSYAFLHEAALTDYPAQNLYMADGELRTYLTPWMDSAACVLPDKAYLSLPFRSPWRFIVLAHDLRGLVASRIMLCLNEPCRLDDTSWIRPMKFIGIWWGMHMKSMTWEQGPRHGATTENMSRYLQFAHDHNIQAVLAEGWNLGWEDWRHFSFTEPYPDWDMDRLAHLADSLGVQIVGHNETGGNAADYEQQLEDAYAYHQSHGIHAIKTGYVSPIIRTRDGLQLNKSQSGVRHYRHVIETAARYHIMIDNHEPVMPTGLQRTFPNLMTQEGVRGQEWNAWSQDGGNPASHVTVLPFTRILAGPVDFTPGVFSFENPAMPGTRVHSTLMNQLGLMVCIYSPLQMACDLPENYMKYPDAFRFIEQVPCDWEQSRLVDGRIGEFCIFARQQRGADDWFVGAVNADDPREAVVPLSMLRADCAYTATIYRDGPKADWQTAPYDYLIETRQLQSSDTLRIPMASGGGFAIRLTPDK